VALVNYFLGVILALLSLSIQTYKPADYTSFHFLMIIVWILLLVSFLAGLYRMERIVVFLQEETKYIGIKQFLNENVLKGEKLNKVKDEAKKANGGKRESYKCQLVTYEVQKWTFVSALIVYLFFKVANIYS
jgi:hypothetical protein